MEANFTGKCNTCGKTRHMAKTCWENNDNAHLRHNNWSSNKGKALEVSAIATAVASGGRMELLLGAIDGVTKNEEPWCVLCAQDVEDDMKEMKEYVCNEGDSWQQLNLAGISFPPSRALLTDPNVFIADTGSTVHSTRFKQKNVIKHNITHQQALSFPKRVFWTLPPSNPRKDSLQ